MALLLSAGHPGVPALDFARRLLQESGGLCGLVGVNPLTLQRQSSGGSDGTALLAALELACRLAQGQIPERTPLTRPEEVAHYLCLRYGNAEQEVLGRAARAARAWSGCRRSAAPPAADRVISPPSINFLVGPERTM